MRLFVDTSVWYAAADTDDRSNGRAREILSAGERLVTTDHVLLETWMERAASFDPDVRVFRFGRRRERAFDVVE